MTSGPGAAVPFQLRPVTVRAVATVRQLAHAAPAIALLWVPVLIALWAELPGTGDIARGVPMLSAMLLAGLAPLLVAAGVARLRTDSPAAAGRLLWAEGWLTERPIRHVLMSVSLAAFFWAFASWKSAIPVVYSFTWDERLGALDTWLIGTSPDLLLAPFFGSPSRIIALDRLYETWWLAQCALLLWQVWQPDLAKAKRFLLAFALVWIALGIFMATAFSSAGPCYAHLITGTDRYQELLARLQAADAVAPLTALQAQDFLWRAHLHGVVPTGGGISAFPSLHVAVAVLGALAVQEKGRVLGVVAWAYMAVVWIASIMLGWHYAVDGLVGVWGAMACWAVSGWLTTPIPETPPATARRDAGPELVFEQKVALRPGQVRQSWSMWPSGQPDTVSLPPASDKDQVLLPKRGMRC
jgi:hypothetical protein